MANTRGGSNAGGSKRLSPPRRSKRLKQSDIPAANTEADVSENQVEKSVPVNLSPTHDVSKDHVSEDHVSEDPVSKDSVSDPDAVKDMEEDSQPLQPKKFFFSHKDYGKSCKLSTRCSIDKTMTALEKLNKLEKQWFTKHKQFKHIWHLAEQVQGNNKLTGLWMLLLRTVCTEKKRVCWFVVNGVPIRYSMREHALITGLDCHEYDSDFNEKNFGSYDFVERVFGSKKVKVSQVIKMLESMDEECNGDRLQVAVLYFLSTIILGRRKFDSICPFILKAVNNLKALETFPWGRLTFEDNMKEIDHAMNHFKGNVRADYLYPGFIIPLEVLAFECIPDLSKQFQESVRGANDGCPLICKRKFKNNGMTGFPLDQLNEALGTTKDIISILQPSGPEEEALLLDITERVEDEDYIDPIVDAWNERLDVQQKKILWEDIYKLDLASRGFGVENVTADEGMEEDPMEEAQQQNIPAAEHWMIKRMKAMEDELKEVKMRLADVARYVNMPREEERTDFESGEARTSFENMAGDDVRMDEDVAHDDEV